MRGKKPERRIWNLYTDREGRHDRFVNVFSEQEIRSMERVSAQCYCIQYAVIEIDCNCNDPELGRFKVIQGHGANR